MTAQKIQLQNQEQAQKSKKSTLQKEALKRARESDSVANFDAIYDGFEQKGIDRKDIKPRINIFTFNAWKELQRVVKRGESGIKIITYIDVTKIDPITGEKVPVSKKKVTTVFHISQTEKLN